MPQHLTTVLLCLPVEQHKPTHLHTSIDCTIFDQHISCTAHPPRTPVYGLAPIFAFDLSLAPWSFIRILTTHSGVVVTTLTMPAQYSLNQQHTIAVHKYNASTFINQVTNACTHSVVTHQRLMPSIDLLVHWLECYDVSLQLWVHWKCKSRQNLSSIHLSIRVLDLGREMSYS